MTTTKAITLFLPKTNIANNMNYSHLENNLIIVHIFIAVILLTRQEKTVKKKESLVY